MKYDVIIVGAGPGGIYSAYELTKKCGGKKIAVFDSGYTLKKRHCPIDGDKIKACIKCKSCSIMSGFGGAGHSPMVNTTLPMILAALCTNTLAKRQLLSLWNTWMRSTWLTEVKVPGCTLPQEPV